MPPVARISTTPLLLALVAGCAPVDKSGPWLEVTPTLARTLQQNLERAREKRGLPGLAMAVAFHDEHRLWVSATGQADLEAKTPWTPEHTSRIGSVTKLFTAAVVYQLVEAGLVSLDDPLERWVPGVWTGVRVRHLLGHSSGIVSYNYVGSFDTSRGYTPQQLLDWAWAHEKPLRFEPGTRFEYSNTNSVLLGLVIERATGQSYEAALTERLFAPLGAGSFRLAGAGEKVAAPLVRCYSPPPHVDTSAVDPSFGWAAGSLVSTPADLARLTDALFFGGVLSPASRALLVTPQGLTSKDETPYGLGAFSESDGTHTLVGHTGGLSGYSTYAFALERPKVTLVVMSNQAKTDLRDAAGHGWAAVLGAPPP